LAEVMPMLPPTRQTLCHRQFSHEPQGFPHRLEQSAGVGGEFDIGLDDETVTAHFETAVRLFF
jgi:hypothetical protein